MIHNHPMLFPILVPTDFAKKKAYRIATVGNRLPHGVCIIQFRYGGMALKNEGF